jgi:hypothetical protein
MGGLSRKCLSTTILISTALLSLVPACFGQGRRGDVIGNIPFEFVLGNRTLPPGRYTVRPLTETTFRIYGAHDQGVLVQTHGAERKPTESVAKIIFHRYGDTHFLSEIWLAGNRIGRQLSASAAEREFAKQSRRQIAVLRAER